MVRRFRVRFHEHEEIIMAVADKTPGTQKDETAETAAGAQQPAAAPQQSTPTTITIPAMPSLNQIMEPKRLLWLGGLAAVGVVGILDWPVVVAAVGVGSYVAERFARSDAAKGRTGR
jgi:hypothetical protein